MRWLAEQVLKAFNAVPELLLGKDDPHFDVLRWWLVFVLVVILIFLGLAVRRAWKGRTRS